MTRQRSWTLKISLTLAFAALVYVGLSMYAGFDEIMDELTRFKFAVLPAVLALSFANYAVRFAKWHFYCRTLDIPVRVWPSFLIFMSGLSMSISPGKLGEVMKSFLLKKVTGTDVSYSAPIVVAERLTDLVALLMLSALGMLFLEFKGLFEKARIVLIIVSVIVIVFVLAMASRKFARGATALFRKLPLVGRKTDKFSAAMESTSRLLTPVNLLAATALSVLSWSMECAGFYLVLWGFGINNVFADYGVFVYSFSIVLGAITMLPGGVGLTELSMTGALTRFQSVGEPAAVAVTLVIRTCTLWFATILGAVFLLIGRNTFKVDISEIDDNLEEDQVP